MKLLILEIARLFGQVCACLIVTIIVAALLTICCLLLYALLTKGLEILMQQTKVVINLIRR